MVGRLDLVSNISGCGLFRSNAPYPYSFMEYHLSITDLEFYLAVVQVLAARGCRNIIVSEISSKRQRFAQDFGAHHVINPSKVDIVQEVRKLSNGRGADLAFDAAGVQVGLDTALKAIRARGTLVNIAIWEKRATLEMNDLVFRERVYMGTATYSHDDFKEVIKAISTGQYLNLVLQ